jgi:hypothetical protein
MNCQLYYKMSLTVSEIYSVRFGPKFSLPRTLQESIAKLRISPASYRPVRLVQKHAPRPKPRVVQDNWRESKLVDFVSRLKNTDDPEYGEIMSKFNKLASKNLDKLSDDIITIIQKRDDQFRLRVSALLFDKAINQHAFSNIMSDLAKKLVSKIPEVNDDLVFQISMFHRLYKTDETVIYPAFGDIDFDKKVILWMNQKDKRRGFAKFLTQLYIREMVAEDNILDSLKNVIDDINEAARKPNTTQSEEAVTQYADFLFETGKLLPATSTHLRSIILDSVKKILEVSRVDIPSLSMRSRFKLEDTVKCVQ